MSKNLGASVTTLWRLSLRLLRAPFSLLLMLRAPFSLLLTLGFRAMVGLRRVLVICLQRKVDRDISSTPNLANLAANNGKKLKVAIIRFDGVGDIALTFPLIDALQKHHDVGEVAFFIPERILGAIKNFISVPIIAVKPFTIHYPRVTWLALHRIFIYSFAGPLLAFFQGMLYSKKLGKFDLVLLPRWDHDLDLNTRYFARGLGRLTYGHDPRLIENQSREGFEFKVLDFLCDSPRRDAHELDHLRDFAELLGISISKRGFLGANMMNKSSKKSKCFLQISAALPKREWSISNWQQLIGVLLENYPDWVFEVNTSSNEAFREIVMGLSPAEKYRINKVDTKNPGELFVQLSQTILYVGSDTGPLHLAESLGVPSVVISCHPSNGKADHVNSPNRFGNSSDTGVWVSPANGLPGCENGCTSEIAHCINQVSTSQVLGGVNEIVERLGIGA